MTPEERQTLREKHVPLDRAPVMCAGCQQNLPCDVIKVLDWAEREMADWLLVQAMAHKISLDEAIVHLGFTREDLEAPDTPLEAPVTADCHHWHLHVDFDGVPVETPYTSAFCPDCGISLQ